MLRCTVTRSPYEDTVTVLVTLTSVQHRHTARPLLWNLMGT